MRGKRSAYRVVAGKEGIRVDLDENFFDNEVIRRDGTTILDYNIATLIQEIRTALYYLGTDDLPKH